MKRLFSSIYGALEPEGLFLFEPHNWKSYRKKYTLTASIKVMYKSIKFQPQDFMSFLEQLGFVLHEVVALEADGATLASCEPGSITVKKTRPSKKSCKNIFVYIKKPLGGARK